ncbi:MAG: FkbM family methyltransferase [Actinomycetes bacterium]
MGDKGLTRAEVEAVGRRGAQVRTYDDGAVSAFVMNRFWMHVEPGDEAISPWLCSDGFWEAWVTTWLMRELQPGDVFIDVGANVGYFTMLARSMGARVVAFEPNPRVAKLLQRSLDEVHATDVVLVTGAVGDQVAAVDLGVPVGHSGGASIMGVSDSEYTISTLVRPLDDVLRALPDYASPNVIKVDAEGAEPQIWRGMQETLAKNPRCVVLLEWESARFDDPAALLNGMRAEGWQVRVIDGAGDELEVSDEELAAMGLQMIAVRRAPAVDRRLSPMRRPYDPNYPYGHLWSVRLGFKHIPKSAGISLSQAIHSAWGLEYRSLLQVQRSADEVIRAREATVACVDDLDLWRGRPFLGGHIGLDDLALLGRSFIFTVLREPAARALSAYTYLRRRSEEGHSERAFGELTDQQVQILEMPTLEWFRASTNDDMTRGLVRGAFPMGTPEQAMVDVWLNSGVVLSTEEYDWLIRRAFERINVAYIGVDAQRIVENLFLQGLLPTLPEVQRLNEAERPLDLAPVSFQDLYGVLRETTSIDRMVIDIAKEMFPGYVLDPCVSSFEDFAASARRYGLIDADSGTVD